MMFLNTLCTILNKVPLSVRPTYQLVHYKHRDFFNSDFEIPMNFVCVIHTPLGNSLT